MSSYTFNIIGTIRQKFICLKSVVKSPVWFGHQLGALTTNQSFLGHMGFSKYIFFNSYCLIEILVVYYLFSCSSGKFVLCLQNSVECFDHSVCVCSSFSTVSPCPRERPLWISTTLWPQVLFWQMSPVPADIMLIEVLQEILFSNLVNGQLLMVESFDFNEGGSQ